MIRTTLIATATAGLALSGAGIAMATGGDAGPQGGGLPAGSVARTAGVTSCDGGAQKQVVNRVYSSPTTFFEGSAVTPPGGSFTMRGPSSGTDVLSVTFSGETNLTGSTDSDERNDWMGVEVWVDGAPVQPYTSAGDVYALAGPGGYDSHAAQFCTRIGSGMHTVKVKLGLHDGGNADSLAGWIDDHTLHATRSN